MQKMLPEIILSNEQEAIFEAFIGGRKNLVVEASPGAGKTFTIEYLFKHTHESQKCLYLVFAKRNQIEAEEKMPENVKVKTLHGFGLSVIRANISIGGINPNKQFDLLKYHFKDALKKGSKETWRKIFILDKVLTILRANLLTLDPVLAEDVLSEYSTGDFDYSDIPLCISLIRKLREVKNGMVVDMPNMIELPAINDFVFPYYNIVACDESQDMSEISMEMVSKIQSDRYIFIGDRRQAIFFFIGSKANSMDTIKRDFECVEYPLGVSRRCAINICKKANELFPDSVNPHKEAIKGEVRRGSILESSAGDFILCRTNLPLVSAYYMLLENNIPCTIIGKEIEKGLKRTLQQFSSDDNTVSELINNLTIELYNLKESKASTQSIIEFEEKKETIEIISRGCNYTSEVILKIEDLFTDKGRRAVKLMTLHKSKGLEADRVFLIRKYNNKNLLPHASAETKQEKISEKFLEYVGITRARKELIEVEF